MGVALRPWALGIVFLHSTSACGELSLCQALGWHCPLVMGTRIPSGTIHSRAHLVTRDRVTEVHRKSLIPEQKNQ